MDLKGWTTAELAHLQRVFAEAEASRPSSKLHVWALAALLAAGSAILTLAVFPLALFGPLAVSLPIMFLLGTALGLLYTHSLRSLQPHRRHHVAATIVMLAAALCLSAVILHQLQLRFASAHSALGLAIVLVCGMLVPYLAERRLH